MLFTRVFKEDLSQEEQYGELDPFYKHQNFLKRLCTSFIIVHRYKQHGMTLMKAFYNKLKEDRVGF